MKKVALAIFISILGTISTSAQSDTSNNKSFNGNVNTGDNSNSNLSPVYASPIPPTSPSSDNRTSPMLNSVTSPSLTPSANFPNIPTSPSPAYDNQGLQAPSDGGGMQYNTTTY